MDRLRVTTFRRPPSAVRRPITRWLPVLLWMAVIYYGSSRSVLPRPLSDQSLWGELLRSLTHVAEYAVLAALNYRALRNTGAQRKEMSHKQETAHGNWGTGHSSASARPRAILLAFAIAFAYAILDEVHQHFVPGRHMTLVDIGLDSAGAVVGVVLRIKN